MKLLIIGDRHIGGYGLAAGQLSFVGHFVRQISQTGRSVSVEAYVQATLSASYATLCQLPLEQYDLIVVQTGQGCLDHPAGFGGLLAATSDEAPDLSGQLVLPPHLMPLPASVPTGVWSSLARLTLLRTLAGLSLLPRVQTVRRELRALLSLLHPYRHKVLLLSPFPQCGRVERWLRQKGRDVLLTEGLRRSFSLFDTDRVIQPREEYFLPDGLHLNAIGHELVGRSLFDFFLAAPTIVSIHSIRRS